MLLPSMMFPGHLNGSNLLGVRYPQLPPNSTPAGLIPSISNPITDPINSDRSGAGTVPQSGPSPGLFPPVFRPITDFGTPAPFWANPFTTLFSFPASSAPMPTLANKNGIGNPIDFSNWNPGPSRSHLIPQWPPHVSNYQPPCVPKSTIDAEPPSKKRHCNTSNNRDTSLACHSITATSKTLSSLSEGAKCCPICFEALPTTSSTQELHRHLMDDAQKTEEMFIQLKRKITGNMAATAALSSTSPDPAVKSRLETFHRVRENRMMRMRDKLATVRLSHRLSPVETKVLVGNESAIHSGNENGSQSLTNSSIHSSSPASRSASRIRTPCSDDPARTPASSSSCSLSPTEAGKPTRCKLCCSTFGSGTTNCKVCHHVLCNDCWEKATNVETPVCPICSTSITRENTPDF